MTKLILIGKTKRAKITEVEDLIFDTIIYNNDGILDPNIRGFIRYDINDKGANMIQIYVRPEARKAGVGTLLLENLEKVAIKNKIKKLYIINSADENDPVYKLFIKMGYLKTAPKLWEKII